MQNVIDTIAILFAIFIVLLMSFQISDWNASRGIFKYHQYAKNEGNAADRYCNSGDDRTVQKTDGTHKSSDDNADGKKGDYDPCQQWRSAQAAREPVDWSRQQALAAWVGAGIGFITLMAAVAAAIFAGQAAFHTRQQALAAWEAIGDTRRLASAVIGVTNVKCRLISPFGVIHVGGGAEHRGSCEFEITNSGQVVATVVYIKVGIILTASTQTTPFTYESEVIEIRVIAPNSPTKRHIEFDVFFRSQMAMPQQTSDIHVECHVNTSWRDVFSEPNQSDRCRDQIFHGVLDGRVMSEA